MPELVYALCAIFSIAVTALLGRHYARTRSRLVFWCCLCFALLAINNVALFVDLVIFPKTDFGGAYLRAGTGALAGIVLLYGLIREFT